MKTRMLCLVCLLALLPALAGADWFTLPEHVTSIGSRAFAETDVSVLTFPPNSLPYDAIQADSFQWDRVEKVYVYKGDAGNSDREKDLYDFIAELKSAENYGFEILRTDPHVSCSANTGIAFAGTLVELTATPENISGAESYQWQQRVDGTDWENCEDAGLGETAGNRICSFTVPSGMTRTRYYRCRMTIDGEETLVSENEIEICYLQDSDIKINLTAEVDGTSVKLRWNPEPEILAEKATFEVYQSDGALDLLDEGITGTEAVLDLLKANTTYRIAVAVSTPGTGGWSRPAFDSSDPLEITTGDGPAAEETVYRALLIGEVDFPNDTCTRNWGDVTILRDMLRKVKGVSKDDLEGGRFGVAAKRNLSAQGILEAIRETFEDADENDVSLLFIATHGDISQTGDQAGSLSTIENTAEGTAWGRLYLYRLALELLDVEGEVRVFLGSCGSGAAVISDEDAREKDEAREKEAEAFASAAVQAFADAAEETGELSSRTGELRKKRFRVMTAADYHQMSWGWERQNSPHTLFPQLLAEGVLSGAETDGSGQITLEALYRYIKENGDGRVFFRVDGNGNWVEYHQNVQVWPQEGMDGYEDPLFLRVEP